MITRVLLQRLANADGGEQFAERNVICRFATSAIFTE